MEDDDLVCSNCNNVIREDDDFCPHCGAIFADDVVCEKHPETGAEGVCIVCATACCTECGETVGGRFLCNRHISCEIVNGMVRVCASINEDEVNQVKSRLEEAGLHPVLYIVKRTIRRGNPCYAPFTQGDNIDGRAFDIRVMVPCAEVSKAEEVLGISGNADSA